MFTPPPLIPRQSLAGFDGGSKAKDRKQKRYRSTSQLRTKETYPLIHPIPWSLARQAKLGEIM
ncbi:hypothetical protein PQY66_00340 [Luminiphilus sp.]|nr:hypothetical protein [Luminiphilus sp.]